MLFRSLRTQSQAIYSPENIGHFGLNLKKYAHFTSPIRRYSDLIVHRALIKALNFGPDGPPDKQSVQLDEISEHLVRTERRSMAAEREATDRYLAHFLADRVGAEFEGRITGVTASGLFIRLEETGADGFCPASRISEEYWAYQEAAQAPQAEAVPLIPFLESLRGRELALGVATNDAEAPALAHLTAAGVVGHFDFIAGSDSGYGGKPAPGQLLGFCAETGVPPDETIMVGDSLHDLKAGRAAGMRTFGVLTGLATQSELAPFADVVCPDIGHLPAWLDRAVSP